MAFSSDRWTEPQWFYSTQGRGCMPLVSFLDGGIVAPSKFNNRAVDLPGSQPVRSFDGGVYFQDGTACEIGIHKRFGYIHVPGHRNSTHLPCLSGCYIYGGLLYENHFGHFVAESLSRLWASSYLDSEFQNIGFLGVSHRSQYHLL